MAHGSIGNQVRQTIGSLDGTTRRAAIASGRAHPVLRDNLQDPTSRTVLFPALAVLWAVGYGLGKPSVSQVARQGLLGLALSTIAAKATKRVVCRSRPNQVADPNRWGRADGKHASFPSGHTANLTALAAVVGLNRGASLVTPVGLGAAAVVAWSSLATDRHWASDLLAGAAVGVTSALLAGAIDRRLVPGETQPDRRDEWPAHRPGDADAAVAGGQGRRF